MMLAGSYVRRELYSEAIRTKIISRTCIATPSTAIFIPTAVLSCAVGLTAKAFEPGPTYGFFAKSSLQFGFRNERVLSDFIPHAGTTNKDSVNVECCLN